MPCEADKIVDLYRRHARSWVKDRGTQRIEARWLDRFCNLQPEHASILDIGCGAGEPIVRYLVERGCSITGVDSAPEMIALFQENFPAQESHTADMRTLSLGRTFNGLLAWNSFFHLSHDDQRRMFPIFRAHAAPCAALMFTSGPFYGEAIGTLAGEPLYHASLDPEEYRELLNKNGFDVVAHRAEDPDCGGLAIWLAQLRERTYIHLQR